MMSLTQVNLQKVSVLALKSLLELLTYRDSTLETILVRHRNNFNQNTVN